MAFRISSNGGVRNIKMVSANQGDAALNGATLTRQDIVELLRGLKLKFTINIDVNIEDLLDQQTVQVQVSQDAAAPETKLDPPQTIQAANKSRPNLVRPPQQQYNHTVFEKTTPSSQSEDKSFEANNQAKQSVPQDAAAILLDEICNSSPPKVRFALDSTSNELKTETKVKLEAAPQLATNFVPSQCLKPAAKVTHQNTPVVLEQASKNEQASATKILDRVMAKPLSVLKQPKPTYSISDMKKGRLIIDSISDTCVLGQDPKDPHIFYIPFSRDILSKLDQMIKSQSQSLETGSPATDVMKGSVLFAKSCEDDHWYRCSVLDVKDDGVLVDYFDYVINETVPLKNLRDVKEDLKDIASLPIAATKIRIKNEDSAHCQKILQGEIGKLWIESFSDNDNVYYATALP